MIYATVTEKILDEKIYEATNQIRHKKKKHPYLWLYDQSKRISLYDFGGFGRKNQN